MNIDELTPIVTAHQNAISQHDLEMAEIRTTVGTVSHKLDQVGAQLNQVGTKLDQVANQQEANAAQQQLNNQAIATLTASILELRNIVSDYIQGRSQI